MYFKAEYGAVTSTRGATASDTSKVISTGTAGTKAAPNANNTGVSISYNLGGERVQAFNATDGSLEKYSYTNDGYLQDVTIRQSDQTVDALRSRRANDELGRVRRIQLRSATL